MGFLHRVITPYQIESLETRRLLDAGISGIVFNDLDRDGVRSVGIDGSMPNYTLFVDINQNGEFDSGEPTAVSSLYGEYAFTSLLPGEYVVRALAEAGWSDTTVQVTLMAGQNKVIDMPLRASRSAGISLVGGRLMAEAPANPTAVDRPAVGVADDGSFIVAWGDYSTGVKARRYHSDGTPNGEVFPAYQTWQSNQSSPATALSEDGRFVIAWMRSGSVYARWFDATGQPATNDVVVRTSATLVGLRRVGESQFAFVWSDGQLFTRIFDAAGNAVSPEVDVGRSGTFQSVQIANDTFVSLWRENGQQLFMSLASIHGTPILSPLLIASHSLNISSAFVACDETAISVYYTTYDGVAYRRHYDFTGTPMGDWKLSAASSIVAMQMTGFGDRVMLHASNNFNLGLSAASILGSGTSISWLPPGGTNQILNPTLAVSRQGHVVAAYVYFTSSTNQISIETQRFRAAPMVVRTAVDQHLTARIVWNESIGTSLEIADFLLTNLSTGQTFNDHVQDVSTEELITTIALSPEGLPAGQYALKAPSSSAQAENGRSTIDDSVVRFSMVQGSDGDDEVYVHYAIGSPLVNIYLNDPARIAPAIALPISSFTSIGPTGPLIVRTMDGDDVLEVDTATLPIGDRLIADMGDHIAGDRLVLDTPTSGTTITAIGAGVTTSLVYSPIQTFPASAGFEHVISRGTSSRHIDFFGPLPYSVTLENTGGSSRINVRSGTYEIGDSASGPNPQFDLYIFSGAIALFDAPLSSIRLLSFQLGGAATLVPGHRVLQTTGVSFNSGGKLDLTDGSLVVNYTGSSPIATLDAHIRNGYADGTWSGNGVSSSMLVNDPGDWTVAAVEASSLFSQFPATWKGRTIDSTTVLIGIAISGDANLSGAVDTVDFNVLSGNYGASSARYSQGDFNYTGTVDSLDLNVFIRNYGKRVEPHAIVEPSDLFGRIEVRGREVLSELS